LAFTKKQKAEMLEQYQKWLKESQAVYVVNFKGMTMKDVDTLRAKARETGSHLHVVKNTLFVRSLDAVNLPHEGSYEGTSLVGFATTDAPTLAKILNDASKGSEIFTIRGGYFGEKALDARQIKAQPAANTSHTTGTHAGRTCPAIGFCRQSSFGATCCRLGIGAVVYNKDHDTWSFIHKRINVGVRNG
jgi:ribosomal protein L10